MTAGLGPESDARVCTMTHAEQLRSHAEARQFELLVKGVLDYAIYMLDADGNVCNWNAGAERAKGYAADDIVGRHFSCFYIEEEQSMGLPAENLQQALREGSCHAEGWRVRKDGSRFWAHVVIQPIYDENGMLHGYTKITRDCSEQRATTQALVATSRNLDLALESMVQGLALFDAEGQLTLCNARWRHLLGLDETSLWPGRRISGMVRAILRAAQGMTAPERHRLRWLILGGRSMADATQTAEFAYQATILCLGRRPLDGGGLLLTVEDVTERRRGEQRIEHMARHDLLTGLPNRLDFQDELQRLLATAGEQARFAVLYLDLDQFKAVNDTLGHQSGDLLLKLTALRLNNVLRDKGQVFRIGGDEFTILMARCHRIDEATDLAQRCVEALTQAFDIASHEVRVGVSIGIVLSNTSHLTIETLMQQADQAMYRAKRDGRNRYRVFEASMNTPLRWQEDMAHQLRHALTHDQLDLHYQPILDAKSGATNALEALLRWTHPVRGSVSPLEFIPVAEEHHLMPELGAWVLRRACRDALQWPAHVRVTVNVSPSQLMREDFMALLLGVLKTTGLAAERLELEITETTMIGDAELPRKILRQVRSLGVGVAMDDFGIGYSSLNLLHEFPFTRVKIDRSFVNGIGRNSRSMAIVRSIIALCQSLDVPVIAEGVENEYQRQLLCDENCSELQGFLFNKALPLSEVLRIVT
ncbi:sensor domain-containing protein [Variovorax sp. RHLX14]|uniref:sensor domain-containing protein n=1 Tax=Variovorax sp. RHLX14 TaxID=1259731 RepID=UPI003F46BDEC